MHPLVLVLALLLVAMALISWHRRSGTWRVPDGVRTALWLLGIGAVLYAAARIHWGVLGLLAWPVLQKTLERFMRQGACRTGPSPGVSNVRTDWLDMSLDHASGRVRGRVLQGSHAGSELDGLGPSELGVVYGECLRDDPEGARLLEAYLERRFGSGWSAQAAFRRARESSDSGGGRGRASAPMSREEALAVLGLEPGASRQEILDAHRRLIQRIHPDRGGSSALAAQVNQAKRLLLEE